MPKVERHAHFLIVSTATEMAGAMYEEMARDNDWYRDWCRTHPNMKEPQLQKRFILAMTPKLLDQARTTLAAMLNGPYDEKMKADIADALIKDNELRRGRHGRQETKH